MIPSLASSSSTTTNHHESKASFKTKNPSSKEPQNPVSKGLKGLKGFVEGGIASIVAGYATHPLDLIKVRMQLQGETHVPNPNLQSLCPALAFHTTSLSAPGSIHVPPPPLPTVAVKVGPIAVGVRIVQQEGVSTLFSGVSATILRQTLYSTTRMGLYDILKKKW